MALDVLLQEEAESHCEEEFISKHRARGPVVSVKGSSARMGKGARRTRRFMARVADDRFVTSLPSSFKQQQQLFDAFSTAQPSQGTIATMEASHVMIWSSNRITK